MQLTIAERADFLQIARQTYNLWSAGLTNTDYRHLLWSTYYQPWSKHNNYRLVYKHKEEVTTSCKVVRLPFLMRGKHYKLLGLGAVYTAPNWRHQGLGTELIKGVINLAKQENIDALLLFSAIDNNFYASCGFRSLGSLDFELYPRIYSLNEAKSGPNNDLSYIHCKDISVEIRSTEILFQQDRTRKTDEQYPRFRFSSFYPWLTDNELAELVRCHNRWLVRQPYGIVRDNHHFAFQLAKFLYFATYSRNSRATLFLTILKDKEKITGYAITECSGTSMRILELIGNESARAHLWRSLIEQAKKMNLIRICGYESSVADFIPSCRLDSDLLKITPLVKPTHIQCYERFWSKPMFLSINKELEIMSNYRPCPLLEFDYF